MLFGVHLVAIVSALAMMRSFERGFSFAEYVLLKLIAYLPDLEDEPEFAPRAPTGPTTAAGGPSSLTKRPPRKSRVPTPAPVTETKKARSGAKGTFDLTLRQIRLQSRFVERHVGAADVAVNLSMAAYTIVIWLVSQVWFMFGPATELYGRERFTQYLDQWIYFALVIVILGQLYSLVRATSLKATATVHALAVFAWFSFLVSAIISYLPESTIDFQMADDARAFFDVLEERLGEIQGDRTARGADAVRVLMAAVGACLGALVMLPSFRDGQQLQAHVEHRAIVAKRHSFLAPLLAAMHLGLSVMAIMAHFRATGHDFVVGQLHVDEAVFLRVRSILLIAPPLVRLFLTRFHAQCHLDASFVMAEVKNEKGEVEVDKHGGALQFRNKLLSNFLTVCTVMAQYIASAVLTFLVAALATANGFDLRERMDRDRAPLHRNYIVFLSLWLAFVHVLAMSFGFLMAAIKARRARRGGAGSATMIGGRRS